MRSFALTVPLVAGVLLVACSDAIPAAPEAKACDDLTQEACLNERYFTGYAPQSADLCSGIAHATQKIAGRRELVLFHGGVITDENVVTEGRFLQRFFAPYELAFYTRQKAEPSALKNALNGNSNSIAQIRYENTEIGKPATPAQEIAIEKATNELLFGDLRKFIGARPKSPNGAINVVVVEHIFSPGLANSLAFESGDRSVVVGLGISPALFKNIAADDPSTNLFEAIGLDEDFAQTLVVGHIDVTTLAQNPDAIVAHELGHSMGLQHTKEPGNLMTQFSASSKCLPGLTDKEVNALKSAATVIDTSCAWRRILDLRASMVRTALARVRSGQ